MSIVGVVLNIYKHPSCFAIWAVTNLAWAVIDFQAGLYAQSALFAVYLGLAVWGLYKWLREDA
jgi:nicotinamide riboside transporter PnuC